MILATSFWQSQNLRDILYIVAFSLFIQGLRGLSGPTTAVRGNRIAAVGMAIAVVATLLNPLEGDQPPVALERIEQRGDHRDRHADRRDAVATHGRGRAGEPPQTLYEQRERDDVEDVAEALALPKRGGEHHGACSLPS